MEERIGDCRLILGDCAEWIADARETLSEPVAVLTDPPYGIGERMSGGTWGAASKYADFRRWDIAPPRALLLALAGSRDYQRPNRNPGLTLSDLWLGYLPTPRASDGDRGGRGDLIQAMRGNSNSHFKAPMLPTPTKRDQRADNWSPAYERRKSPTIDALSSRHGRTGIHALLELVEWMLGYPPSWHASGSEPTATPLSRRSRKASAWQ